MKQVPLALALCLLTLGAGCGGDPECSADGMTCPPHGTQTTLVGLFNDSGATRIFTVRAITDGVPVTLFGPEEMFAGRRIPELATVTSGPAERLGLELTVDATYGERLAQRTVLVPRLTDVMSCALAYGEWARGPQVYPTCDPLDDEMTRVSYLPGTTR